ncbi:hypothetical protein NIES37_60680 [Tolypothrix tenuis PCC 7101]|uniref:Uncharacterized protein n=1 Tax=Tolypothrix tenuis PCC 7101 TaxID=231146 RepID=A0A1Z4N8P1_9CYAN|nr:hypothetical protein [Aulosira sp. FACHB-113]BAZ02060.1 hypothetical protein NIES37_60680 [Tolypothrix tenuis PCC 7101]BAZ74017.1 hypothetical protein NIES50_25870 [Aulosira laxa NIES-50]
MTALVQELLNTFEQLTDSERLEFASEILKRIIHLDFPPLSDEDLILNAEGIFLELDQRESAHE